MANLATISNNILADSGIDPINLIVGTGTVNYVPKFTSEDTIANSLLVDNGTNLTYSGEEIIVNKTAGSFLTLLSSTTAEQYIQFKDVDGAAGAIGYSHSTNAMIFKTNGATNLTLNSSGNLGLGVTPSAWSGFTALDISNVGSLAVYPSFGVSLFRNAYYDGSVYRYKITSAASYYDQNSNASHIWYNAPSGTAGNAISFTQAMTLDASGRLGIGTTSPIFRLDVQSAAGVGIRVRNTFNTDDAYLEAQTTLGSALFGINATGQYLYNGIAIPILFYTNATERMRLDANGSLGLGFTNPSSYAKLAILGSSYLQTASAIAYSSTSFMGSGMNLRLKSGGTPVTGTTTGISLGVGGNAEAYFGAVQNASGYAELVYQTFDGSAYGERMRITSGGNVGIGTASPSSKLSVEGSTYIYSSVAGNFISLLLQNSSTATTSRNTLQFSNDIGAVGLIDAFGNNWGATGGGDDVANGFRVLAPGAGGLSLRASAGTLRFYTSSSEHMRITAAGLVGIGTSAPVQKLSVVGTTDIISYSNGTTTGYLYSDANGIGLFNGAIASGTGIYARTSNILDFYYNGNIGIRLNSTGAVRFNAYGSGSKTGTVAYNLAVDSSGNIIETAGGVVDGSGTANYVPRWQDANTLTNSIIYDNGTNVGIGTASPYAKLDVYVASTLANTNMVSLTMPAWSTNDGYYKNIIWNDNPNIVGAIGMFYSVGVTNMDFHSFYNGSYTSNVLMRIRGNGNILIGTTTDAGYKLQVSGNTYINGTQGLIRVRTDVNGRIDILGQSGYASFIYFGEIAQSDKGVLGYAAGSNDLVYRSGATTISDGTERFRITSAGNVGIGTNAPVQRLEVKGADDNIVQAIFQSTGGGNAGYNGGIQLGNAASSQNSQIYHSSAGDNTLNFVGIPSSGSLSIAAPASGGGCPSYFIMGNNDSAGVAGPNVIMSANRELLFGLGNSFSSATGGTFSELMRVSSNGNVGIGTSSPGYKLDVQGNAGIVTLNTNGSLSAGGQFISGLGEFVSSSSGTSINFRAGATHLMILQYGGNVGIGTTSPINIGTTIQTSGAAFSTTATKNSNMYGLTLVSTTNENTMSGVWFGSGGGVHWSGIAGSRTNYTVDWSTHLSFYTHVANTVNITDATEKMRITGDGNVGIGTTAPTYKLQVEGGGLYISSDYDLVFQQPNGYSHGIVWKNTSYTKDSASIRPTNQTSWAIQGIGFFTGNASNSTTAPSLRMDIQPWGDVIFYNNVGIGTTSTATRLTLGSYLGARLPYINGTGNSFNAEGITVTSSNTSNASIGGGLDLTNNVYSVGSFSPIISFSSRTTSGSYNNNYAAIYGILAGDSGDGNWNTGHLAFATTTAYGATEKMRITSSGNVGINTSSPGYKLEVNGGAVGNNIARFTTGGGGGGTRGMTIYSNDSYVKLQVTDNAGSASTWAHLALNPDGGYVGVGTSSPTANLHVNGDANIGVMNISGAVGGGPTLIGTFKPSNSSSVNTTYEFQMNPAGGAYGNFTVKNVDPGINQTLFYLGAQSLAGDSYINVPSTAQNISLRVSGTQRFYLQGSTGYIGIGTTAPSRTLHLVGTSRHERVYGYGNNVLAIPNSITYGTVWVHLGTCGAFTTDKIYYRVNTNTSEEEGEITVSNTCSLPFVQWQRNTYNRMVVQVKARMTGGCGNCEIWVQVLYGSDFLGANTTLQWQAYNGTDSGFSVVNAIGTPGTGTNEKNLSGVEGYFYANSGSIFAADNVGIGTVSPAYKLDVNGTARFLSLGIVQASNNSDVPNITFTNNGGAYTWGIVGALLQGDGDGALYFKTKIGGSVTEKMRITSGGLVGIGTSSPSYTLDVSGAGNMLNINKTSASAGYIANLAVSGSQKQYSYWNGTSLEFGVIGTSYFSSRVGIGTTSPDSILVSNYGTLTTFNSSDIRTTTALLLTANDPGTTSSSHAVSLAFRPITNRGAAATITVYNESTNKEGGAVFTFNSGGGAYPSSITERMRITSAGNVGVATTTPTSKLSVNSAISTSSTNVISIMQNTTGANKDAAVFGVSIQNGGESTNAADLYIGTASGGAISERMRITSGGNVAIGTSAPASKLGINFNGRTVTGLELATVDTDLRPPYYAIRANIPTVRLGSNSVTGVYLSFTETTALANGRATGVLTEVDGSTSININGGIVAIYGRVGTTTAHTTGHAYGVFGLTSNSNTNGFGVVAGIGSDVNWSGKAGLLAYSSNTTDNVALFYNGNGEVARVTGAGLVGIGTTNPTSPLTFGKASYGAPSSEDFFRIKFEDFGGIHNDVGIGQFASGSLGFNVCAGSYIAFNEGTNGERMRIAAGGNVGIGTSGPTAKLTIAISNSSHANEGILLTSSGGYGEGAIYHDYGQGNGLTAFKIRNLYGGSEINLSQDSYSSFGSPSSIIFSTSPISGSNTPVERMRITSTGNVGIGNTNPGDFSGDANTLVLGSTGTTLAGMTIANNTTGTGGIYFADGTDGTNKEYRGYFSYYHGDDSLTIGAGGAGRVSITATATDVFSGNFLVSNGSIKTGTPTGGTAVPWKLGSRITNSCGLPTTYADFAASFMVSNKVIEVEVDGVLVYIPIVNPGWC